MPKLHLVLLIHAHQPVGNFDEVLERAYRKSYLPFVEMLKRHPTICLGLHYSGHLLEWIEKHHAEFFDKLKELVARGQVELVGGGFYEPILISILPQDRLEQIRRQADYLEKKFGRRPAGLWLAERVWEPQLPTTLAATGVEYTLVDDVHFLAAGFEPGELHAAYVAEDLGARVTLLPGLKALRYLVPFGSVEANIEYLRGVAREHPGGLAAMGDDCEKFGLWPKTYEHCYENRWLEQYFAALEENAEWLTLRTPGEYLAAHPPRRRADLPAASYTEMMEWALPTETRQRFHNVSQEFAGRADVTRFLRGGSWRNFFSKYAEANLLHKKMLHVSAKVQRLAASARRGMPFRRALEEATTRLLRAQCNDAYWHGIFGGLYAPHLRTELWRALVRAESLADAAEHGRAQYSEYGRFDFDADGEEEVYVASESFAALCKPSDGATLAALDYRTSGVTLVNSIQRRREAYHARLAEAASAGDAGLASIHEQVRVKETGLERRLRYDRWPRHAFRLLLFPEGKTFQDYEALRLEESAAFAGGAYTVAAAGEDHADFICDGPPLGTGAEAAAEGRLHAKKKLSFQRVTDGFEITCDVELQNRSNAGVQFQAGMEVVLNLLAPNEPDRYFESRGERHRLNWSAAVAASELRLADEWQDVAIVLEAPAAREFWIAPIETVSESEEGFERVYQGSQILCVWPVQLAPDALWSGQTMLRVGPAKRGTRK